MANSDYKDILQIFARNHVEYLIVGGYAFGKYAEPRYTKDMDLWVNPTKKNARLVWGSLVEFGAPLRASGVTENTFCDPESIYQIGVAPVRIDIIMSLEGVTFEKAWSRRVESNFGGVTAAFISLDDLILVKELAGRPQDLADVKTLKIARSLEKKPSQESSTHNRSLEQDVDIEWDR